MSEGAWRGGLTAFFGEFIETSGGCTALYGYCFPGKGFRSLDERVRAECCGIVCLAGVVCGGVGQEPAPDTQTLRVTARLVVLDVTVTDSKGNFVSGAA